MYAVDKKGVRKSSLDAMGLELMNLQYGCSALTELSGQLGGAHFVILYVYYTCRDEIWSEVIRWLGWCTVLASDFSWPLIELISTWSYCGVKVKLFLPLQVTGALRNLADVTGAVETFINAGVVRNLSIVLGPYSSDSDVVWNVCRALRYKIYDVSLWRFRQYLLHPFKGEVLGSGSSLHVSVGNLYFWKSVTHRILLFFL